MYPRNRAALPSALALSLTSFVTADCAFAQSAEGAPQVLPPVTVEQKAATPSKKKTKSAKAQPVTAPSTEGASPEATTDGSAGPLQAVGTRSGSLTSPTEREARTEINRTPGGVAVVSGASYQASTPAATVKDALDYVPGVLIHSSEGEQSHRFSIRGSGLSDNAETRGVQLLMDGVIPLTRATGDTSFEEIDPTAYRYIEVYKGANALRWGANGLGGAINFVTPTGHDSHLFGARFDIGSFGFTEWAATSGGVYGAADYFVSVSALEEDGFREHTDGERLHALANVGYKITEDIETRFYLNFTDLSRRFAGTVIKEQALSDPKSALVRPGSCTFVPGANVPRCTGNDNVDWNIGKELDSIRVANKTSVRLAPGTFVEFGGFYLKRDTEFRVFGFLMSEAEEEGGFLRLADDRAIGGFGNRFVAGINLHYGTQQREDFFNDFGKKGPIFAKYDQKSENVAAYAEDSFFVLPTLAVVGGFQYAFVSREQKADFGIQDLARDYYLASPKIGLIWDVTPAAQIFANVSRSAEAPTYSESYFDPSKTAKLLDPQKATTYEVGTRGDTPDFKWELAFYRSELKDEFQCQSLPGGTGFCTQVNIPKSIHQGVEVGVSAALLKGMFEAGPRVDKLWLNAAYTFSDFHFDNDPIAGNNELPGQPRHFLRAELLYKHPSGVYFGPNVEWVPEDYFADNANTFTADSYAIWGAKAGFDNGGPVAFYVEGRNLADTAYIAEANIVEKANPATSTLFFPGNGRAVYSGIRVRW